MIRLAIPLLLTMVTSGGDEPAADRALTEAFSRIVDATAPSIVEVEVESWSEVPREGLKDGIPQGAERYWGRAPGRACGVVVSGDGFVLASEYMVGDSPGAILVHTADGETHAAEIVARNPRLDAILLRAKGLSAPPIPLAREGAPEEGQFVVTVGRTGPGDQVVVTTGMVSAIARLDGRAIQVDSGIHPANLGGAIVDLEGRVIAMPGLFHRRVGWNSGVGFAAPAPSLAAWFAEVAGEMTFRDEPLVPPEATAGARAFEAEVVGMVQKALRAFVKVGGGSGVVITPDGKVLTNDHVAGSMELWEVTFHSGERYRAKLLGRDPKGDLAMLQIEGGEDFPHIPLGEAEHIRTGRYAAAFGNPFGFAKEGRPTVSLGVISAIHRFQGDYGDSIQVDTPINPGNSGGPLLDLEGHLIGICGRMAWRVDFVPRVSTGVGFAIPVTQIRNFLPILEKEGAEAQHGSIDGLTLEWIEGSVVVAEVAEEGAGEKAGFEIFDEIVRAAGESVTTPDRFRGILSTYPAGTELEIRVLRDGQVRDLTATLGGQPFAGVGGKPERGVPEAYIGITYGRSTMEGVEVWEVAPGSPADWIHIRKGDWITAFRGKPAKGAIQIQGELKRCRYDEKVDIEILRGGETLKLRVTVINSEDYDPNATPPADPDDPGEGDSDEPADGESGE